MQLSSSVSMSDWNVLCVSTVVGDFVGTTACRFLDVGAVVPMVSVHPQNLGISFFCGDLGFPTGPPVCPASLCRPPGHFRPSSRLQWVSSADEYVVPSMLMSDSRLNCD